VLIEISTSVFRALFTGEQRPVSAHLVWTRKEITAGEHFVSFVSPGYLRGTRICPPATQSADADKS
jgi:hypothetical protein